MEREQIKVVIIGHIDHGKSTLIGRLLYDTNSLPDDKMKEIKKVCEELGRIVEFAYIIDNLQEEREQQMTLDTAQTFFKTKKKDYVIIDAPGHKEFIKNMITGASQADLAILLIDAKEGIKEQTKRHSYIIKMLGIKNLIVTINKIDLIDYDKNKFNILKDEILEILLKLDIKPINIIPISALLGENISKTSENIKWYEGKTLLDSLDNVRLIKNKSNLLRLPIQDVYSVDNKKILVGKIVSGSIKTGDKVNILPDKKEDIINSIEIFNSKKDSASEGECIGITLKEGNDASVGTIICKRESLPRITKEFKARLFWMKDTDLNIKNNLILKCATQETKCKIKNIYKRIDSSTLEIIEENAKLLKETEVGEVIINTEKDLVVEDFNDIPELGRFVIIKDLNTAGAGIITNC
jgi:sulfate adenylyltransferase large subunit